MRNLKVQKCVRHTKDMKLIIEFSRWNKSLRAIHFFSCVRKCINFRKYSQFYTFEKRPRQKVILLAKYGPMSRQLNEAELKS